MRNSKLAAKLATLYAEREKIRAKIHRSEWEDSAFELQERSFLASGRAISLLASGTFAGIELELDTAMRAEPWRSFAGRIKKLVRKLRGKSEGQKPYNFRRHHS